MAFLFLFGVGTPAGNTTPRHVRDWYQDSSTGDLWVSTGLTVNDWQRQTDPVAIGGAVKECSHGRNL